MGLQELDTTEQLTLYVESIVKKKNETNVPIYKTEIDPQT